MRQQTVHQRLTVFPVSPGDSSTKSDGVECQPGPAFENDNKLMERKLPETTNTELRPAAIPLRRPARQVKKPVFRLSAKLRRRLRPGLPRTPVQRQIVASGQVTSPRVALISNDTQTLRKNDNPGRPAPARVFTPYKEVKAKIVSLPNRSDSRAGNALILQGDYWEATYEGKTAMLDDTRGLRYIAVLIQQASRGPIHAGELVALATGNSSTVVELETREPIMDSKAESRLIKRLEEIGFERNSASAQNDYGTVAALDEEVERIAGELQNVRTPRKGRDGRASFNTSTEKARKAVSKAISETISKMDGHPDLEPLACHLRTAIQKGQWLSYNCNVQWDIKFHIPPIEKSGPRIAPVATRKVASAKAGASK